MSAEEAIALIAVAIGIPSALTSAILLYILGELRQINKRLYVLENP